MENRQKGIETIMTSFQSIKRHFVCQSKQSGLTHAQWGILWLIRGKEGISIGKVAEILGTSSSAVTQFINDLEKKWLVHRKSSPNDKRILEIWLTEEAKEQFIAMSDERAHHLTTLFDVLDDDEFAQYVALTQKLISRM